MSSVSFAAVLLAGGRSSRMGRDKALLPLRDGRRLWERQLDVLRSLGAAELFISGSAREGFPPDVTLLADGAAGLGPLAGIAAALRAMRSTILVVLAVDLPAITPEFLRGLLAEERIASGDRGVVPQSADGLFEALAAVYPYAALPMAEGRLRGDDRSMQGFVRALIDRGLATAFPVREADAGLFINWNRPEDFLG